MKPRYIFTILLVTIAMAAILPIKYHFAEKKIASLPQMITSDRAIHGTLPHKIDSLAARHKCYGFIIPIIALKPPEQEPDNSLDHLGVDANLAPASYSRWRLKVDERTQSEIKASMKNF